MRKLTLINKTQDEDCTVENYACDFVVTCAGDSIWGDTEGRRVHVTGIVVITDNDPDVNVMVNVIHDSTWDIYSDTGFEEAISNVVGFDVTFTEQGMQADEEASMEA